MWRNTRKCLCIGCNSALGSVSNHAGRPARLLTCWPYQPRKSAFGSRTVGIPIFGTLEPWFVKSGRLHLAGGDQWVGYAFPTCQNTAVKRWTSLRLLKCQQPCINASEKPGCSWSMWEMFLVTCRLFHGSMFINWSCMLPSSQRISSDSCDSRCSKKVTSGDVTKPTTF